MGSKIYPKVHENPRAFFSSSSLSLLESSIQYPWGVGLHHLLCLFHFFVGNCSWREWKRDMLLL
ncbi:hypothetical protein HKD37_14G040727 [Glycine soja]